MKIARYAFAILLGLSGLGHSVGTFLFYTPGTDVFVWSLAASAFVVAVIIFNLFALSGRPEHLIVATGAALVWIGLVFGFGQAIGNLLDPRILMHAVAAGGLVAVNVIELVRGQRNAALPAV
ncbi:hypothetical protein [Rhizobium alvei]|uniref:SPW repeat-containing protein n=1 Tax=Rhizobium alvei TaxID=1132659 RepID=A0ABT8YQE7_9HYPH|nr:hypothetical protein [Rhizobium alvei]MDO6965542.1 hypothetical protein [Rhizobium alvei]